MDFSSDSWCLCHYSYLGGENNGIKTSALKLADWPLVLLMVTYQATHICLAEKGTIVIHASNLVLLIHRWELV